MLRDWLLEEMININCPFSSKDYGEKLQEVNTGNSQLCIYVYFHIPRQVRGRVRNEHAHYACAKIMFMYTHQKTFSE